MKNFLKILVLCACYLPGFSQEYIFKPRRLQFSKDAMTNYISGLERDQYGNLWVATRNGVLRFDGHFFEDFRGQDGKMRFDKKQFNCSFLRAGKLYLGTQKGVNIINTQSCQNEKFNDSINRGVVIRDVYAGPNGWVYWISEDGSLVAKEEKGEGAKKIFLSGGAYNARITGIGNDLYCLMDTIFYVLNAGDLSVKTRKAISVNSVSGRFVSANNGKILFVKGKNLYRFRQDDGELSILHVFPNEVTDLSITPYGLFSIENGNTLVYYDSIGSSKAGTKVDMGFNAPIYFSGLLYLKEQLLMRSSNGLFIIDINPRYFKTLFQTYDSTGNFFYDPRGIAEAGDNVFLFSYPKLHVWNRKTGKIGKVMTSQKLGAHAVLTENDTIWIATESSFGLVKFNSKNREWKSYIPGPGQGKDNAGISSICLWGKDRFLLGSYSGVYEYSRGDKSLKLLKLSLPEWNGIQPFVEDVASLGDGGFIVATNRGTYRIDSTLKVKTFFSPRDGNSLSDQAHDILITPQGSLWLGTSNGLFNYDLNGNLIRYFTASSGIAGDRIASLIMDRSGNLWVGTFSGLSCIQAGTNKIFNFHMDEGLPDNEFNHASAGLLKSGEIIMGTTKGFVVFEPEKCLQNQKIFSRVSLSKLEYGTVNGQKFLYENEALKENEILLGRDINYAKLFLRHGEEKYLDNVDFDYLIEGVHETWQSAGSSDYIQIINLRPGWYNLKVRMLVEGSIIEDSEQVFKINTREYFYKTTWFYLLMAGVIFLLVIIYLRSLLLRERKIRELRLMLSQNLHDEVGSYLTGISMNLDLIGKKPESISKYQQSISELSRKALAALKDGLWSLDRESDNGQHFWDRVKVIAKESFEPLGINYSINAPDNLSEIRLEILQKNQLIYVIKECFTNALKYGRGNAVSILWDKSGERHRIVIKNRKSPDTVSAGGLMGMDNIKFRMSKLGGNVAWEESAQEFSVILSLDFIK